VISPCRRVDTAAVVAARVVVVVVTARVVARARVVVWKQPQVSPRAESLSRQDKTCKLNIKLSQRRRREKSSGVKGRRRGETVLVRIRFVRLYVVEV
jgi:hypothetical protein